MFDFLRQLVRLCLGRRSIRSNARGDRSAQRGQWRWQRRTTATFESLERRELLATLPFGAAGDDTAEFMLGNIYVSVVLMESTPTLSPFQPSTEDWTPALIQETKDKIEAGLDWWQDTLRTISPTHANSLNFILDYQFADNPVRTGFEPISSPSNSFESWMYDFLNQVGYNQTGDFSRDIRQFNNSQRTAHNADWAFTIFVVNSTNDQDDMFAPGGSFNRAFAYAGGRFIVVPSGRPAASFAHETGHIFWARDEYCGGADFYDRRGYYNTQNSNACDNAPNGFVQQPSIMSNNSMMDTAFANHTSAASTLAMIGWQDADGDGIFDVLDVPLTLEGNGYWDANTGAYRFLGSSAVQTLPNRNSSGLQNDITLNKVSRAEFRLDGGDWQTAATYNRYSANLDLTIPLPAGSHSIDIRTIDAMTGITSPIFHGSTSQASSVTQPGVSGFLWRDADADGEWDGAERPLAGWTVQLVDANGALLPLEKRVEPDDFAAGTAIGTAVAGVTLSATGLETNGLVGTAASSFVSTGSRSLQKGSGALATPNWTTGWTSNDKLRMDFTTPTSSVSLDAIAVHNGAVGRLEIYDQQDNLLARYNTAALTVGQVETMRLLRPTADIKYAIAYAHVDRKDVAFDNLRVGPAASATTDAQGAYDFPSLPTGNYFVRTVAPTWWSAQGLAPADRAVNFAAGTTTPNINLAQRGRQTDWHNYANATDINNDGFIAPNDALRIINELNSTGSRALGDPGPDGPSSFLDADGDGFVAPSDALRVINRLNAATGSAEGENGSAGQTSADAVASGEASSSVSVVTDFVADGEDASRLVLLAGRDAAARTPQLFARSTPLQLADFLATRSRRRLGSLTDTIQLIATDVDSVWHSSHDDEPPHVHEHDD